MTVFLFIPKLPRQTEDLSGGTMTAKISSPPCARDGVIDTGAPKELRLDDRLLQEDKDKVKTKEVFNNKQQENKNTKTTHRRVMRAASSSSSSSLSSKSTTVPYEKGESTRSKA